jgi:hypothetical protein
MNKAKPYYGKMEKLLKDIEGFFFGHPMGIVNILIVQVLLIFILRGTMDIIRSPIWDNPPEYYLETNLKMYPEEPESIDGWHHFTLYWGIDTIWNSDTIPQWKFWK